MTVLYEDNHVIAVVKPVGMPVQGDETGDRSLLDEVREWRRTNEGKPGDAFVGLVHRLDRPVGGVVVFGKTSKGASRLSEQFRTHTVTKRYLAVVEGSPTSKKGEVRQWLRKDERTNTVEAFDAEVPESRFAELSYAVLEERDGLALVEVVPKTGRSHQIRVAMASLGCPIMGDRKYGARTDMAGGAIALFARSLTFTKPVGGEEITVTAEPEWSFFGR